MKKFKFLLSIFLVGLTTVAWGQMKVSGTVTDGEGHPLPGASVIEKGTTNGTVSDFNGEYSIDIGSSNPTLVVSYIGFETAEKTVGPSVSTMDIVLQEDSTVLDDVVVIGYGTSSKEKITGAVVSIDAESIQEFSNANFDQAIVGKLPGVDILT